MQMDNLLERPRSVGSYADGLSSLFAEITNQNVIVTQAKRAKQNAKSLMTTKVIVAQAINFQNNNKL